MFLNTKAKVSGITEVVLPQLVLSDLQSPLQDLLSLGSPDSAVDSDLFITTDAERSDSVASFGENRLLTSKLFQDLQKKEH